MRLAKLLTIWLVVLLMHACGGGSAPSTFVIGGSVSGLLDGGSVSLLNNGADQLTRSSNGVYSFNTPVTSNYQITVGTQPYWQTCSVSNGSGYASSNVTNVGTACVDARAVTTTFAGSSTLGSNDGTGPAASFHYPAGVALNANGYIYVTDGGNNVIRKISPSGVVTTFAGSGARGQINGIGTAASFNGPDHLALDSQGNLYVADSYNNVIRKVTPTGDVMTFAGSGSSGATNGDGSAASFRAPLGIAVDANGNVFVADYANNMIRKITPSGVVSTFAGSTTAGHSDGEGVAASFQNPWGLAFDLYGNLYVADTSNHMIRKITPAGVVTTFAGSTIFGAVDGTGSAASFNRPAGIAVDRMGNVYVAELENQIIRKITNAGVVTTLAGSGAYAYADGIGTAASFAVPSGLAVDLEGVIYVADRHNHTIRKIAPAR